MGIPVMLDIKEKKVLVIGGGVVATRKIIKLLSENACITCISKEFTKELHDFVPKIELIKKEIKIEFDTENHIDITPYFLVIIATNDVEINKYFADYCTKHNKLMQTVDRVNYSDISFMASKSIEEITIAVATNGKSPTFAKNLLEKLEKQVTKKDIEQLEILEKERNIRIRSKKLHKD